MHTWFLLPGGNPKRVFTFMETVKVALSVGLAASCYRDSATHRPHSLPRALNWVCEHLDFILISFVHPLARRVLRYQKSQRKVFFRSGDTQKCFQTN